MPCCAVRCQAWGVRVVLRLKTYLPSWEPGPALELQLEAAAREIHPQGRKALPPVGPR